MLLKLLFNIVPLNPQAPYFEETFQIICFITLLCPLRIVVKKLLFDKILANDVIQFCEEKERFQYFIYRKPIYLLDIL